MSTFIEVMLFLWIFLVSMSISYLFGRCSTLEKKVRELEEKGTNEPNP
jgi:hypothetical protein